MTFVKGPFHPNRSQGAGEQHGPGHSVPPQNLWPSVSLLTAHEQFPQGSHLVGEDLQVKVMSFNVLVDPGK